jgi:hypothetical protein
MNVMVNWDFVPSRPSLRRRIRVAEGFLRRSRPAPRFAPIRRIFDSSTGWIAYFAFLPDGRLQPRHHFTLTRLQALDRHVCVIVACPEPTQIDERVGSLSDALYWKEMQGYDFSAYRIVLSEMASQCPGRDLFVMNDSLFGPFVDLGPVFQRLRWGLSGLTASNQVENHIQSCAFQFGAVKPSTLGALRSVFLPGLCLSDRMDVVLCQETRLARVAASHMTVGSLWFERGEGKIDMTLDRPFELLKRGYPFMKCSLLHPNRPPQCAEAVLSALRDLGHPVPSCRVDGTGQT